MENEIEKVIKEKSEKVGLIANEDLTNKVKARLLKSIDERFVLEAYREVISEKLGVDLNGKKKRGRRKKGTS